MSAIASPSSPARLVVLVSGYGSNLQALMDACAGGCLASLAQVTAVISNKSEAYALQRAVSAGIPALPFPKPKELDRRVYDARLADLAASCHPDWIVLAGWMRILSDEFLGKFPWRVINLHPALPGAFPGVEAIQRAYEAFQRREISGTGVMVHLVPDEGVDTGPVLSKQEVPIEPGDTLEQLEERVHAVEHRLLVQCVYNLVSDSGFVERMRHAHRTSLSSC